MHIPLDEGARRPHLKLNRVCSFPIGYEWRMKIKVVVNRQNMGHMVQYLGNKAHYI